MARRAAALLAVVLLCCCSDPEEELRALPREVASQLRAGEIGDALDALDDSFEAHGLDKAGVQRLLLHLRAFDPPRPYVAEVVLNPADEGQDERALVVVGILPTGDPASTRPRSLRPFRLEARARRVDGGWKIIRARLER